MYQYAWESYDRWWHGRFWPRIDRSAGPEGCWPWMGYLSPKGYGVVRYNGKAPRVHRLAYHFLVGPLPHIRMLQLDHRCRNRVCCNPTHLELVTGRENLMRGATHAAVNAAKTHCHRGHPLEGENLYRYADGHRACRACMRDAGRRHDHKRHGYLGNAPNAQKTHCPRGHAYEGENLYVASNGKRYCRVCTRAAGRRHDAKRRAAGGHR